MKSKPSPFTFTESEGAPQVYEMGEGDFQGPVNIREFKTPS